MVKAVLNLRLAEIYSFIIIQTRNDRKLLLKNKCEPKRTGMKLTIVAIKHTTGTNINE